MSSRISSSVESSSRLVKRLFVNFSSFVVVSFSLCLFCFWLFSIKEKIQRQNKSLVDVKLGSFFHALQVDSFARRNWKKVVVDWSQNFVDFSDLLAIFERIQHDLVEHGNVFDACFANHLRRGVVHDFS